MQSLSARRRLLNCSAHRGGGRFPPGVRSCHWIIQRRLVGEHEPECDRKAGEQDYINFPSALTQTTKFSKGETAEWIVADKGNLVLWRRDLPSNPVAVE